MLNVRRNGGRLSRWRLRSGCARTHGGTSGAGVDAAFDAIGGSHFARSFACLTPGGLLVGYGSQTMASGAKVCFPRDWAWRDLNYGAH